MGKRVEAQITIFDTLIRFHRRNENDANEMSNFFATAFDVYQRETDSVIGFGHHLSKPQGDRERSSVMHALRGSTEIVNWPSTVWGLDLDGERRTLKLAKNRWVQEGASRVVTLNTDDDGNPVSLSSEAATEIGADLVGGKLAVAMERGCMRADLVDAVEDAEKVSRDTCGKAVSRFLKRTHCKKKRKGNAMRYWLPEYAPEDAE